MIKREVEITDRVYKEVKDHHGLYGYYTRKNISVEYEICSKREILPSG